MHSKKEDVNVLFLIVRKFFIMNLAFFFAFLPSHKTCCPQTFLNEGPIRSIIGSELLDVLWIRDGLRKETFKDGGCLL